VLTVWKGKTFLSFLSKQLPETFGIIETTVHGPEGLCYYSNVPYQHSTEEEAVDFHDKTVAWLKTKEQE
jgi:hypothetical protein